jgi:hypothetical protein
MHDNAFATKKFTRNAAQQAIKQNICNNFRSSESEILVAMQQKVARYAFPSAANSRNRILAINELLDPPNCLLLLSYGVLTVTNPSRDVPYKPVTVWPLSSAVICFQRISSPMR